MKKIALLLLLVSYTFSFSQENYKYVIVPKKFSFFNEDNKYNTNLLTKSFFESEGFLVFYDTEIMPEELSKSRCLALFVDVNEDKSLFQKKVSVEIKDCRNNTLYISAQGSSKEKEFDKAYNMAFRSALSSLKGKVKFKTSSEAVVQTPTRILPVTQSKNIAQSALFAIPVQNGFKIVDDVPNVVYELLATSIENVYSAKKGNITGTFLKKNAGWFFEYYENDQLVSEKVNVKF
jgi:hypothetical protein